MGLRGAVLLLELVLVSCKPKNVLFLSIDDLRPQMSCFSHPGFDLPSKGMHTENICKLAQDSLVLHRAQVGMSTCSPSRTVTLTGRHPGTTKVWDLKAYWRDVTGNFTTIPQFFKEHGYHAVGMGKIFHPGAASGAFNCSLCTGGDDGIWSWSEEYYHGHDPVGSNRSWVSVSKEVTEKTPLQDTQVVEHAKKTIARVAKMDKPFFIAVGFHKPHLPFVSPEEYYSLYEDVEVATNPFAPVDMPSVAWQTYGETRGFPDIAKLNLTGDINSSFPTWLAKNLRRAYYASVSYNDYNIGEVLKALEATGKANDTIVSFWGDHGYQLGEHGQWDKHTNFDIATHIPMMFKAPGLTDGGIASHEITETVDMFPTLVDLAMGSSHIPAKCPHDSTNIKTCVEGVSLTSLIKSPKEPVKEAALSVYNRGWNWPAGVDTEDHTYLTRGFDEDDVQASENFPFSTCLTGGSKKGQGCTMGYSMLTRYDGHECRYTEWVHFPGPSANFKPRWSEKKGVELYNHTDDPAENHNLASLLRGSQVLAALSQRLHRIAVPGETEQAVIV